MNTGRFHVYIYISFVYFKGVSLKDPTLCPECKMSKPIMVT